MKIVMTVLLGLLILLALASGTAKIMLMPQEIEFYRPRGFSDPLPMLFGGLQVLSGLGMALKKYRRFAALLLAATFLFSAVLLIQAGNLPLTGVTLICVLLLGVSAKSSGNDSNQLI